VRVSNVTTISFPTWCEIQAQIESNAFNKPFLIRYYFPPSLQKSVDVQNGDPFVPALLLLAMRLGEQLEINSPVSRKLLGSVPRIQSIYKRWDPTLSEVADKSPIRQGERGADRPRNVGLFFSCGVDSFYSLLRNIKNHAKDDDAIDDLIVVNGFDIFLRRKSRLFARVLSNAAKVGQETGKRILPLATNIRDLSDRFVDWGLLYHGAAMASMGLALGSVFERIYISATHHETEPLPWGSSPILDPLWSTESLSFFHDGSEVRRVEKIRSIARVPIVLDTLRVCTTHSYSDKVYNCGSCSKCFRTMIGLHLVGALGKCRTLPRTVDVQLLRNVYTPRRTFVGELISSLGSSDKDSAIKSALKETISGDALSWTIRHLFHLITYFFFVYVPILAPIWNALQRLLSRQRN